MSTVTYVPTRSLRVGDTLLVDASTVGVAAITPDEYDDDAVWLKLDCYLGNFDRFDAAVRVGLDVEWRVLDAER